jgi:hypothetical protein
MSKKTLRVETEKQAAAVCRELALIRRGGKRTGMVFLYSDDKVFAGNTLVSAVNNVLERSVFILPQQAQIRAICGDKEKP